MVASRELRVDVVGDARNLERTFRRATKATEQFGASVTKSSLGISKLGGALVGGFLGSQALSQLVSTLSHFVSVAAEAEQVLTSTKFALEQAGITWTSYGKQVEDAIAAQSRLGFDDEDLMRSLAVFVRTTDDVTTALERNELAMDVARSTGMDYEAAANLVAAAAAGQSRAMRQLRIAIPQGAGPLKLLTILEQKFGGAAKNASRDAATGMDRFKVSLENAEEALGGLMLPTVGKVADAFTDAADAVKFFGEQLDRIPGRSVRPTAALTDLLKPFTQLPGFLKGPPGGNVFAGRGKLPWQTGDAKNALDPIEKAWTQAIKDFGAVITHAIEKESNALNQKAGPSRELRNRWFDAMIGRRVDRVQDIETLQGQVEELKKIAKIIDARIKITKDITRKLTLEDEALGVQRQILATQAQIAEEAKQAAERAKEAAKERREAEQERRENAQFAALGLGPGGAAPIPGAAALRRRLGRVADAVRGTVLDTPQMRKRLKSIRAVISGEFGALTDDVARRIEEMLAAIDEKLGQRRRRRMEFRKVGTDEMLRGLGLSPEEIRALRGRLAGAAGGKVPLGGPTAFGMGLGGATVVNVYGNVVTPDSDKFIRDMQKRGKRNRPQQRGVRPGVNVGGA